MKNKDVHSFVLKRLKSIEGYLAAYQKENDSEFLHLLRVEVKTCKAVFHFLESLEEVSVKMEKLNPLFHEAGKIRELQLTTDILQALPTFPEQHILVMRERERKLNDKFISNIPRYLTIVKTFRKGLKLEQSFPDKKVIKHYFKDKVKELFIDPDLKDRKDMHLFRKEIKRLMYVYKSLPKKLKEDFKLNKRYLDKLQQKAGRWHDIYVAIDFLLHQRPSKIVSECMNLLKAKENMKFNLLIEFRDKEVKVID